MQPNQSKGSPIRHPQPLSPPRGEGGRRPGEGSPPALLDSGERRDFTTGSRRDKRTGKGRFDLLPARALRRLARHFEAGSVKYGDRNWEKGQPLSVYLDSALRHANTYMEGKTDEDHLIAAVWNLLCLADTEERIKEGLLPVVLSDLPKTVLQEWKFYCLTCVQETGGTGEPPLRCPVCAKEEKKIHYAILNSVAKTWHCGKCHAAHDFTDSMTGHKWTCLPCKATNQL